MLLNQFRCTNCGAGLKSTRGVRVGREMDCPRCQDRFVVSRPAARRRARPDGEEWEARRPARRPHPSIRKASPGLLILGLVGVLVLVLGAGGAGLFLLLRQGPAA